MSWSSCKTASDFAHIVAPTPCKRQHKMEGGANSGAEPTFLHALKGLQHIGSVPDERHKYEGCVFSGALRHIVWANKRYVVLMMLHVLSSEPIRGKRKWRCSTRRSLHLSQHCLQSSAAYLPVYTNLGKLCTVVLHVFSSALIRGYYAKWFCTHWHLYQSGDTMPGDSGCIGFCTNQSGVVHNGLARVDVCYNKRPVCTVELHVLASVPINWMYAQRS